MSPRPFPAVLAKTLSDARGEVSQAELSRRSGISRNVIANIEARRQSISLDQFIRLALALGVEPNELITEELTAAAMPFPPALEEDFFTENDRRVLLSALAVDEDA